MHTLMTGRRVIFVLEPFPFPSGGVAVIYRHAEILAMHGIPAFVALPQRPPVDFYGSRAPLIIHQGRLPVKAGDIFVIPEGFPTYVKALAAAPVKRLMFLPEPVLPALWCRPEGWLRRVRHRIERYGERFPARRVWPDGRPGDPLRDRHRDLFTRLRKAAADRIHAAKASG